jgi:hypothetical protein
MAAGLLAGAMIGLLAGPVGVAIGAGGGTLAGALFDLAEVGVGADFLEEIGRELEPGKVAVVADVWEDWVTPVDTRIEAAGGTVLRRVRAEIADAQIAREAEALKPRRPSCAPRSLARPGPRRPSSRVRVEGIRKKLRADQERTQAALASVKREMEGTVARVQAKAAKAHGERKAGSRRARPPCAPTSGAAARSCARPLSSSSRRWRFDHDDPSGSSSRCDRRHRDRGRRVPGIHRGWLIALGIGLILLGTVALFVPWVATLTSVAVFGWTVFFGGALEIAAAIGMRGWRGVLVHLLSGSWEWSSARWCSCTLPRARSG